ncbi:MAG: glyoxalase [Rhodanobacter sp.]|nr:MAG: glyoxalase [Rhodanobacter sp.]TAL95941.1 MAG: glyoxalase [Rhodanobacter sp.]TAM40413.1 MAG: glyoxalase [Rhodanobacter sp.]TAN23238.1 MAG: glyoxalase [Rhodanobacter sp.]
MAVTSRAAGIHVAGLLHLRLCSAQAKSLATFYETALGFRQLAVEHLSGARAQERFGITGRALRITLELGAQRIRLLQFVDHPGRDYPADSGASDLVFQHFAIVVTDMGKAMAQLSQVPGWTPITRDGPQQLPASSGGVTAFKFRDPEGHPLELLAFPPDNMPARWASRQGGGPFLGIDHSAISVADGERSVAFYESLGLKLSQQSVNDDPAQARLDHLEHPRVEVIAMEPARTTPHVELLCYGGTEKEGRLALRANDVAATCLVFEPDKRCVRPEACFAPVLDLIDPEGHRLAIVWPER